MDASRFIDPPLHDNNRLNAICDHIQRYIGPLDLVVHEHKSTFVHVDVHIVPPGTDRPFYTLVTSGLSAAPMRRGCEHHAELVHAELMMFLPPTWPGIGRCGDPLPSNKKVLGPLNTLRSLARYPHQYDQWIGVGHTFQDRPSQLGPRFTGLLLTTPRLVKVPPLSLPVGPVIDFLLVSPLYESEIQYKLSMGFQALLERFDRHGISEIVDTSRPNVCQVRGMARRILRRR